MKAERSVVSWCLFDFANSSYSAVISAVVFPVYFVSVIVGNEGGLGDLWWGRAVSASMAFVALSSPFLGGIADFSGKRKKLLISYTILCVASVAAFSVLREGMVAAGFILAVIANIGMEGGIVFYNSYLTGIASKEYQGRVSAWGYATGYVGSILSLLAALLLAAKGLYGFIWIMVSCFFFFFAIPAFLFLPSDRATGVSLVGAAVEGGRQARQLFKMVLRQQDLRRFMTAFFIYEDGVNTVIVFSSIYAATTLGFGHGELVGLYIAVQATALAGSLAMAKPIDLFGPKKVLTGSLLLWTSVAVAAFFVQEKRLFWLVAGIAGLGLGTVQAASRAFFAQFIPAGEESKYFGIYALVGKSSAIAGPLVFGVVSVALGSQRPAILAIASFFITGLVIVRFVRGGGPNIAGRVP